MVLERRYTGVSTIWLQLERAGSKPRGDPQSPRVHRTISGAMRFQIHGTRGFTLRSFLSFLSSSDCTVYGIARMFETFEGHRAARGPITHLNPSHSQEVLVLDSQLLLMSISVHLLEEFMYAVRAYWRNIRPLKAFISSSVSFLLCIIHFKNQMKLRF